eukprot:snap_masked-scaffold_2-processed-gene-19.23-mRNA-1 protein AED:0.07 eAED:0.07 QI:0/0/0/0.5/1/1/2/0/476
MGLENEPHIALPPNVVRSSFLDDVKSKVTEYIPLIETTAENIVSGVGLYPEQFSQVKSLWTKAKSLISNSNDPPKIYHGTDDAQLSAFFVNESPYRVSIWWTLAEEVTRVIDSLPVGEKTGLNTFDGHSFIFTREGTRDQLGPIFTASSRSDNEFILTATLVDQYREENKCQDRYPQKCSNWANFGECEKNPGWMIVNCPSSCKGCDLLDPAKRCDPNFLNTSAENIWSPGDLNKMFEKILNDQNAVEQFGITKVEPLGKHKDSDLWVLQFDSFLSDIEVDVLLSWGGKLGFQRSTDTGKANERGEVTKVFSQGRTSTNTWCTKECESDPVVKNISQRIINLTNVPYDNYEQFQLLRYEDGQFYKVHHDMGPPKYIPGTDIVLGGGVRILTFFLYLSDVEEGGETDFPEVGIKVKPKKGRAILWPSVLDRDPMKQDRRTVHSALPVKKGLKFAANHWIHSHNFKKANLWGCTGAFD